jgi:hypothetical protein
MHRSGTSAVTRVLSLLGATLPRNVLGPGLGNGEGHWEPSELVALHDRMLAEVGSSWFDWRRLDRALLKPWHERLAEGIGSEYEGASTFVLKDPRLCRFVPTYEQVLEALGVRPIYLLVLRHPLAVSASLGKRNGFSPEFSHLMWLRHVLDAEFATRGAARSALFYEAFLAVWPAGRGRAHGQAGMASTASPEQAEAIADYLSPEHAHHASPAAGLPGRDLISRWLDATLGAMHLIAGDPEDEAAAITLDRVRSEFDAAAGPFGAATFGEMARLERELVRLREVEQRYTVASAPTAPARTHCAIPFASPAGRWTTGGCSAPARCSSVFLRCSGRPAARSRCPRSRRRRPSRRCSRTASASCSRSPPSPSRRSGRG